MGKLSSFAAYILEHLLEDYVTEYIAQVKTADIPLLRYFAHLNEQDFHERAREGALKFLNNLVEGTALEEATRSLFLWKEDKLDGVSRSQIHPADIILVYSVQKMALTSLLTRYTTDPHLILDIIHEIDVYLATAKRNAVEVLFEIQKETEANLAKKHKQLEEAQAIAHIGSWEWDMANHTLEWSREMFDIFEYEPQPMPLPEDLVVAFMAEWNIKRDGQFYALINTGKPFEKESMVTNSEGREKVLLHRGQGLKDESGKITRVVGTTQDITEIRLAEIEKELSRQKDEFIGIASHELKTPLTVIKGYLQLLEEDLGKDNQYLEKALQHTDRLHQLVLDLLDITRIEAGKMKIEEDVLDLRSLLNETIESYRIKKAKHQIQLEEQGEELRVLGDPQRIEQVLTNLLDNAIKYSPNADAIEVKALKEKEKIRVQVRDFGIGISQENINGLFTRFFRAEGLGPNFPGLGIGLYISNEIVKRHKGRMWVESKENEGSVFAFELPAYAEKDR